MKPGVVRLPLDNGDRLSQPEFHRRYETYPDGVKIELVGGVVYTASPLGLEHSDYTEEVGYLLGTYRQATPGVQCLHNATTILGEDSEPQPDLGLRILPAFGGQTTEVGGTQGLAAPEHAAFVERLTGGKPGSP